MRPFSVRAPNKSSGDRVRDLKAKNIFNGAKSSFRNNINRGYSILMYTLELV